MEQTAHSKTRRQTVISLILSSICKLTQFKFHFVSFFLSFFTCFLLFFVGHDSRSVGLDTIRCLQNTKMCKLLHHNAEESALAYFKLLCRHSPGCTEGGWLVSDYSIALCQLLTKPSRSEIRRVTAVLSPEQFNIKLNSLSPLLHWSRILHGLLCSGYLEYFGEGVEANNYVEGGWNFKTDWTKTDLPDSSGIISS